MKHFSDRLAFLIKTLGFNSAHEFARAIGYRHSEKIQRLLRDSGNHPSYQILQDIANKFVNIDMRWLITGEGQPELPNIVNEPMPAYGASIEARLQALEARVMALEARIAELEKIVKNKNKNT